MGLKGISSGWTCDICDTQKINKSGSEPPKDWSDHCCFMIDGKTVVGKFTACGNCLGRRGQKLDIRKLFKKFFKMN